MTDAEWKKQEILSFLMLLLIFNYPILAIPAILAISSPDLASPSLFLFFLFGHLETSFPGIPVNLVLVLVPPL